MERNLIKAIEVDDLSNEVFDLQEKVKQISDELNDSGLLIKSIDIPNYSFTKDIIHGLYEDNIWVLKRHLYKTFSYFDFVELEELRFKGITEVDINLIKCWIAEAIFDLNVENNEEGIFCKCVDKLRYKYILIVKFINETSNFSKEYLDSKKGSKLRSFFDNMMSNVRKSNTTSAISEYIEYIQNKVSDEFVERTNQYLLNINMLDIPKVSSNSRKLPRASQILIFSSYLKRFFADSNVDEKLKLYYMPLLIWWKLTTVIPIRPSEFCIGLKRDCLVKKNGDYYISINRLKKKANLKRKLLPVLNKFKITKEIYDLISDYILLTSEDDSSKTLISYKTMLELRKWFDGSKYKISSNITKHDKIDNEYFTLTILSTLLERFYEGIITDMYNDTHIEERLSPGDTRHIAFTSLMLQGYSPIEIAILGGHRTLATLDNYTCSVKSYVDSEVINIIKNNIKLDSTGYNRAMDVLSKMSPICSVPMEDCVPGDIDGEEIGFCKVIKNNPNACYIEECYDCVNWWCEPSEYNFLKLEKVLKRKLVDEDNKLERDLDFLKKLFAEVGIEVVNGRLVIEHNVAQGLRRMALELESNAKRGIELKYKLVNPCDESLQLISDLESLLPMKEINDYIEKNMIEILEN